MPTPVKATQLAQAIRQVMTAQSGSASDVAVHPDASLGNPSDPAAFFILDAPVGRFVIVVAPAKQ